MSGYHRANIPPGMLMRVIQSKFNIILYYGKLRKMTPDNRNIDIINEIREGEINQLHSFENLYVSLFGDKPEVARSFIPQIDTFLEGVKSSIMNEWSFYEFYSNVFFGDDNPEVRNVFLRALMDENKHAAKLNFMLTDSYCPC